VTAAPARAASRRDAYWALAALAAAIAPFLFALPPWLAGVALVFIAWRAALLARGARLPPAPLRLTLAGLALVAVVLAFRGLGGAEAGGAFLVLTAALKGLESRSRRDFRLVALLAYFLIAAFFLLEQSLPGALYAGAVVWLATAALLVPGSRERGPRLMRRAGALLLAALPVAAIFFVLFPRLPGPLFRFGAPRSAAVSGLPDTLDPGAIASLSRSNAIAFRVHFRGRLPPAGERYFRGPVFERFDGRRWLPSRQRGTGHFEPHGKALHYRVLERGNGTHYLFALALPAQVSTAARLSTRYVLRAPHRLWNDTSFDAISYPEHRAGNSLSPADRRADLALPPGADPRARTLAHRWRNRAGNPGDVVQMALAWFRRKPFRYTLQPPRTPGRNGVDRFLFHTRRGFCEHYASAFAVLMRAAGIPARIVTGYAGGTLNPYDGWLVVRQANAHAWDEVWLPGRGWVRVDPTSVIPPGRVDASAAEAAATSPAGNANFHAGWLWHVRNLWDAVDTAWTQYVAGYGSGMQQRLLGRLGLGGSGPVTTALIMLAAALAAGALVLMLGTLRGWRRSGDPAQHLYRRWCRRPARLGVRRHPTEGPLHFADRVARQAPGLGGEAAEVALLYVRARYGDDPRALTRLRRLLRRR